MKPFMMKWVVVAVVMLRLKILLFRWCLWPPIKPAIDHWHLVGWPDLGRREGLFIWEDGDYTLFTWCPCQSAVIVSQQWECHQCFWSFGFEERRQPPRFLFMIIWPHWSIWNCYTMTHDSLWVWYLLLRFSQWFNFATRQLLLPSFVSRPGPVTGWWDQVCTRDNKMQTLSFSFLLAARSRCAKAEERSFIHLLCYVYFC